MSARSSPLRHGLAALSLVCGLPAWGAEATYTIDPDHTFPNFETSHLGFSTLRGRFDETRGRLVFDESGKRGSVEIEIQASSIDTGVKALDEILRAEDFLNVQAFPTVLFRASDFKFDGSRLVSVEGELTMRGVTRPLTLTVTHYKCGLNIAVFKPVCGADVEATLRRSDFGMTKFLPFVVDDVRLRIQVEALRDSAGN